MLIDVRALPEGLPMIITFIETFSDMNPLTLGEARLMAEGLAFSQSFYS